MKLNVTHKVFIAILAANAIIVLSMFLIMQWSMDRGFLSYVNRLEQSRIDRLADKLEQAYSKSGGWEQLKKAPDAIPRLISETAAEYSAQTPPPAANDNKKDLQQPEPPLQRRFSRLERRIVVLDAKQNPVFAVNNPSDIKTYKPISVNGKVVGYLGLLPSKFLSDIHQLRFVKEQKLVFALTTIVMLLVAVAISLPLARRLARPLRKLAAATSHLSAGRYDIRVPVDSDDEFGHLSRNFNALALTLDITLEHDKKGVTVNFRDSAPGVTDEERGKLFDRLYRVEGSRNRSSGGAGLGLAICRKIVEAHEGAIEALHSPLGGLWIRITLPLNEGCQ